MEAEELDVSEVAFNRRGEIVLVDSVKDKVEVN